MGDHDQDQLLGAFADIADLLEEKTETESLWDKDRNNSFEYQDFLEKEEKRLKRIDSLFSHKFENFCLNSRPEVISNQGQERTSKLKLKLIQQLTPHNSSMHTEIQQMWRSLFESI